MRISDWSSDVCSSDLRCRLAHAGLVIQHDTLPALVDIDTIRAQPQSQPLEFAYRFSGLRLTRPACLQLQHLERGALTLHHQPRKDQLAQSLRRSEEHTSELQSLMRISYAVFCLKKKTQLSPHKHSIKTRQQNNKPKQI